MSRFSCLLPLLLVTWLPLRADFLGQLSAEERARLGLATLTAAQQEALNAAVERYRTEGASVAAAAAVQDYRTREEPAVVAQAVQEARSKPAAVEPIRSRLKGRFRGWSGSTVFELENGQIWKQLGSDHYRAAPLDQPEVEIRPSGNGYHRLYLPDGIWVSVRRLK